MAKDNPGQIVSWLLYSILSIAFFWIPNKLQLEANSKLGCMGWLCCTLSSCMPTYRGLEDAWHPRRHYLLWGVSSP